MKRRLTIAWPLLCLALALPAHAHRAWILPVSTVLSGDEPWVTLDAAISNDIFFTDYYAMPLQDVKVIGPDGKSVSLKNASEGHLRSTFDLQLLEEGTYKVSALASGIYAFWQENGEEKGWRGSGEDFAKQVPADAEALRVTEYLRRIETFVTAGAPSKRVFTRAKEGLSLVPVTHPNDLYQNETATFAFTIDGKPAVGAEIEIIPHGTRYRDRQDIIKHTTDKKGQFSVQWPDAGRYWLGVTYEDDKAKRKDAKRSATYMATFEVLPL